jgi:hypothetical protein
MATLSSLDEPGNDSARRQSGFRVEFAEKEATTPGFGMTSFTTPLSSKDAQNRARLPGGIQKACLLGTKLEKNWCCR